MAIFYEGYRYDLTSLGPFSGADTRLVPKAGTLSLRRKGARISSNGSGGPGSVLFGISDPGTIVPGDTVSVNGSGATGTVEAAFYTSSTIQVNWSGGTSWNIGDRLIVSNVVPNGYSDPYLLSSLGSTIAFGGSNGLASFYSHMSELDFIRTVGSAVDILPDQAGLGPKHSYSPLDSGMIADGSTNDAAAIQNRITYLATKGRGVIDLPPGDIFLSSGLVVSAFTGGLVFQGQGRGVTRIYSTSHAFIMFALAASTDVVFKDLTFIRTAAAANQPVVSIANSCTRVRFNRVHFSSCGIAVQDQGTDTVYDDVFCDGNSWGKGIYLLGAVRPKVKNLVSRISTSLAAADGFIDIDGAISPHFEDIDIKPSAPLTHTGIAVRIRNAATSDVIISNSALSGGDNPGNERAAIRIEDGKSVTILGTTLEDSLSGIQIAGGTGNIGSVLASACTVVGTSEHGIAVTANYGTLQIADHKSSNIGEKSPNTYDHLFLDPNLGTFATKVNGIIYGNFIRGAGPSARYVCNAGQFAQPPDITGVYGDPSALGTAVFLMNAALIPSIAHNEDQSGSTESHAAVAWPTFNSTSTTPTVPKRKVVRMTAAVTITNFTGGRNGQAITVWNASGGTLTITDGANIIARVAGNIVLNRGAGASFEYDGTSAVWREV